MFLSRNSENIYGYTGKKKPNFNFVSGGLSNKKAFVEPKPKPQISIRNEKIKDNPVKILKFINCLDEFCGLFYLNEEEEHEIPFDMNLTGFLEWIHSSIFLRIHDELITIQIQSHEKGYSVKTEVFSFKINIQVSEDIQTISFSKKILDPDIKVVESKISFENTEYPFHFQFETNMKCDGIFNDFVQTTLPEIKPPNFYTVPVKYTENLISFREYISYIKTRTFVHFKVNESGWYIESIEDNLLESVDDFPNGVKIKSKSSWTYYPRGKRIEHNIVFI